MSLSIGIVGLPNVGKSTLFNALTKRSVPAENYPFCTIDPSVGVVAVPDERLDKLADFSKSLKKIPAAVEFVDIAGLVKGAAGGEGLGNKFLSHVREVDAIAHVVRVFEDPNILHVHGKPDPFHDIDIIKTELILADLEVVEKRLSGIDKEVRRGDKNAIVEKEELARAKELLERGEDAKQIKSLSLLSAKPVIYVLNNKGTNDACRRYSLSHCIEIDIKTEEEISKMPSEEQMGMRRELEMREGLDALIKESYELLGLISFLTTGHDETRAWTIRKDSSAPEAGSAIHSDFRDKFIRAEVINWRTLLDAGSYAVAREKGLLRTEGKEYVVRDGDVIEFKI